MIGQTISHYRVIEKLGGGMGVEYQAEGMRLDRFVALEFRPDEFSRDAQTRDFGLGPKSPPYQPLDTASTSFA